MARWQIYIDRGGTFTDALGVHPVTGRVHVAKVLSSDRAPLLAIRALLGLSEDAPIPACEVRMGTTLATNALLERRGAKTALLITEGFGDLLRIGDQTRPDLFAAEIVRPEPLYAEALELRARHAPDGAVLEEPDEASTRASLSALCARGIESVAVSVLHAHRNPALEQRLADWAREAGIAHASAGHEVASEIGLLDRTETTVVDAYVTPLLRRYADALQRELPGSSLQLMQSSGTLCAAHALRGRDAVLSGPAGGAVAVARIARELGLPAAIGFDMGGTSTDVLRCGADHALPRVYEMRVRGARLRAPAIDIHTVAAGGGSLCRLEGNRLSVGPHSAGAAPGPLCYGRAEASELALTDINLALGRILPDRFPLPLERARVEAALDRIAAQLSMTRLEVAQGFFEVAIDHMAEAIARVSNARGHDAREHALIAFGGASGQHACALARRLGMRRVVLHPHAGVLSAWGMGGAGEGWHGQRDAGAATLAELGSPEHEAALEALERAGRAELVARGHRAETLTCTRRADLRYRGTEATLTLPLAPAEAMLRAFEAEHLAIFGYTRPEHPIEAAVLRVEVSAPPAEAPGLAHQVEPARAATAPARTAALCIEGALVQVPVFEREALRPGQRIVGPAIVLEAIGTIVVDPGFALTARGDGVLWLEDEGSLPRARTGTENRPATQDPVALEIMGHRFMAIAEQMGSVLGRTAISTNIRERLDYSCALFDERGGLVSNAPHIPVHLGAMSETVRAVLGLHPVMQRGDVFCANDPALGGSHLPDITVITPVFAREGERDTLAFFTASRGHHADVGGITPGSMPPFSTALEQEGVVFRGLRIARAGRFDEAAVRDVLRSEPYPARDPDQNVADLRAQIAANRRGEALLLELIEERGLPFVRAYMQHVQRDAELRVRAAIAALPAGEHAFSDTLDDGTRIAVRVRVHGDSLEIDFGGSSAEVASNLNAPRAVTVAAVIYAMRMLVGAPIPLNGGCLAPVTLNIPERSVLAPSAQCAVAAGNVETSQRVVDVLLGALGRLAASQGTMNNLTFGNSEFGYYETIAGGAGASARAAGASGVHTHMTNTRITDPEILEARFPVRLLRFALRPGSGGEGRMRGGDGVVRELLALTALDASILSDRRTRAPFGLRGGGSGRCGLNLLNDAPIPARAQLALEPGDRLRIETPGGGGWGVVEAGSFPEKKRG